MFDVLIALSSSTKPFVGYVVEKLHGSTQQQLVEAVQARGDAIVEEFGPEACLLIDSRLVLIEADEPVRKLGLSWIDRDKALVTIPLLLEGDGNEDGEPPVTGYEITNQDVVNLYALKSGNPDDVSEEDLNWLQEAGLVQHGKPVIDPDDLK